MNPPLASAPRRRIVAAMFVGVLTAIGALYVTPVRERLDGAALDATQRLVRAVSPRAAVENVVIVGIDEQTEQEWSEPFTMWHRHLGGALSVIASGKPRLVALDIVLPERSYDNLVPGLDADLLKGLLAVKHASLLVVGMRLDARGTPQPIYDLLLAAIGRDALGLAYVTVDRDGTARRFDAPVLRGTVGFPMLAERIGLSLGLRREHGVTDFSCGKPFSYVSVQDLISRARERPNEIRELLEGKIVLLGKIGPDDDPLRQPLSLAAWAPNASTPPGVVYIAQSIRALQSGRILPELSLAAFLALVVLSATPVLVAAAWRTWAVAGVLAAVILMGVYIAFLAGVVVPPTIPIAAVILGAIVRSSYEAYWNRQFRLTIERQFAGYVSRNLLEAMLAGEVDPRQPRKYANLGFLFADLRGFTSMTENLPAAEVLALLNRYYEAITPAIHMHDGTIDNFRGDGILAIFGAPRPAADGPLRAVLAARQMFERLERLNSELALEGRVMLDMGVGITSGDAVAGNVGTSSRYGYSAVGDAVNVAARLQSHCKPLRMKIIASESVMMAGATELCFVPLGRLELPGHASIEAFGVPKVREYSSVAAPNKSLGQSTSLM